MKKEKYEILKKIIVLLIELKDPHECGTEKWKIANEIEDLEVALLEDYS